MVGLGGLNSKLSEFLFDQVAMTHRFVVQIDIGDYDLGTWTRVTGLTVSWNKHTYRAGDNNDEVVVPGNVNYQTIKLSRAACSDSDKVQKWLVDTSRRHKGYSGAVSMLDYLGIEIVHWKLKQFFPIAWSISDFDSAAAKPAIEMLELAHTGFLDDESTTRGTK
jgi:phage tail-like protein